MRVLTVVDIASGDGRFIHDNTLEGERVLDRVPNFDWAIQGIPSTSDWTAWRKVVKGSLLLAQSILLEYIGT